MDKTARIWDVETGDEIYTLSSHTAEIISISFNRAGTLLLTASFDNTAILWDVQKGRKLHALIGHHGEISSACISFDGNSVLTGSIDKTARVWEVQSGKCITTLRYAGRPCCVVHLASFAQRLRCMSSKIASHLCSAAVTMMMSWTLRSICQAPCL